MRPHVAVIVRRARGGARTLDACDHAALSCALVLGRTLEAEVDAFAFGDSKDDDALELALRAGCHRATRIDDRGLKRIEYLATARTLALAIGRANPTLVVCGENDEHGGAIGPALAEWLDIAHLGSVVDARRVDDGALEVERRVAGVVHRYRTPMPVLLCVASFPGGHLARVAGRRTRTLLTPLELELEREELEARALGGSSPTRRTPPRAELFDDPRALVARLREVRR